jgi:hypothetical protein
MVVACVDADEIDQFDVEGVDKHKAPDRFGVFGGLEAD